MSKTLVRVAHGALVTTTNDWQARGSTNDLAWLTERYVENARSLFEVALKLADSPHREVPFPPATRSRFAQRSHSPSVRSTQYTHVSSVASYSASGLVAMAMPTAPPVAVTGATRIAPPGPYGGLCTAQ